MAKWNKELTFEAIIDARGNHNRWDTDFDTLERLADLAAPQTPIDDRYRYGTTPAASRPAGC